ncbi:MAG: GNAT family N-acetyltransferase [Clostridia bacterium]|nr:GNAT family N-acetyltransferase [Clostridia bacterium]
MENLAYISLRERPELLEKAVRWFHEKWGVPEEAYRAEMRAALEGRTPYVWCLCLDGEKIVGGLGVIENDFNDRKDLAPNVCAVYTEEAYRGQGIAGRLLRLAAADEAKKGIFTLYLLTGHADFYERYGWKYFSTAQGDFDDRPSRVYVTRTLETERLFLRPWGIDDAEDLFTYAKDPAVGPAAGWPPHRSAEESREVIRNVLSGEECYAVCRKEDGKAFGSMKLMLRGHTRMTDRDDECELGYWIGKPFWGKGLATEAAGELIRRGFEELGMRRIWCRYADGNERSKRVQEKCGFRYQGAVTSEDGGIHHVNLLTREDWEKENR